MVKSLHHLTEQDLLEEHLEFSELYMDERDRELRSVELGLDEETEWDHANGRYRRPGRVEKAKRNRRERSSVVREPLNGEGDRLTDSDLSEEA